MTKHINFKSAKYIVIIGLVALALHYGVLYFLQMTSIWLWAFYLYFMVSINVFYIYYPKSTNLPIAATDRRTKQTIK